MRNTEYGMDCHFSGEAPDPRFLSHDSKPHYAPDRLYTPTHVKIVAKLDVKKKTFEGTCTTQVELLSNTEEIFFHAADMKILNVTVNGKKSTHTFDSEKEKITIPTKGMKGKGSVAITYRVTNPSLGIFFIHPTKEQPNKPYQAWTHSEAQEARYWYPCQDQPETKCPIEYVITVQHPFKVVANGNLIGVKKNTPKGWDTFHWKFDEPNPSYLNAFMAGDFAEIHDEWNGIDVQYYCEKGREDEIKRAFGNTPKMLKFFSEFTGYTYPHKKYAQVAVADFIFGGMEHTTCTTQTDLYLQDKKAHDEYWYPGEMLAAHELAHQWFGDLLTCRDWSHGWLNESFATYFEALWMEHHFGIDEFRYEMLQAYRSYTDEDKSKYRRPIVTNQYTEPSDLFDRHLYEKGALLLHSIRNMIGDDAFRKSIQYYVEKNAGKTVITEDLLTAFRTVSGKNLTQFFDEFVYQGGHPELKTETYYDAKKKETTLRIIQTQSGGLYHFPAKIGIVPQSGKTIIETKQIDEKENIFTFSTKGMPKNVVFDVDVSILKAVTHSKPREMWYYQLENDPHVVHRISAAYEIAKYASEKDIVMVEKAMKKDSFWGVREEAAAALATTKLSSAYKKIMDAYRHEKDNRVKQGMLRALSEYASHDIHDFLIEQTKVTNSYLVPAEAYRALGKTRNADHLSVLEKGTRVPSWIDVIANGAIAGMTALQTEEAMEKILKYAHPSNSNRIRQTVASALGVIGIGREKAMWKLVEMTKDPYINLQISAAASLGLIGDKRVIPDLEKLQKGHRDPRLKRTALESIRKINGVLDLSSKKDDSKKKKNEKKGKKGSK